MTDRELLERRDAREKRVEEIRNKRWHEEQDARIAKQTAERKVRVEERSARREEKLRSSAEKRQRKLERRQQIEKKFSSSVTSNVLRAFSKNELSIGMPYEMVGFLLGPAYERQETVSSSKERVRVKFGRGKKNQRGNYTYKVETVFENGLLKSYKTL